VGGYAVLRIDPAIVADEVVPDAVGTERMTPPRQARTTTEDVRVAFGE
jgi:hypothetical protein